MLWLIHDLDVNTLKLKLIQPELIFTIYFKLRIQIQQQTFS